MLNFGVVTPIFDLTTVASIMATIGEYVLAYLPFIIAITVATAFVGLGMRLVRKNHVK